MPSPRSPWLPVAPVLALLVLSVATLAAPADQRLGWSALALVVGGPLALLAGLLLLRAELKRLPAPVTGEGPAPAERSLLFLLRAVLVAGPLLGPLLVVFTEYALAQRATSVPTAVLNLALPFVFPLVGVRLWRDLRALRAHRAEGLPPEAAPRPSVTGDAAVDARIGRPPRAAARLTWGVGFVSALAWISPGHALIAQLAKVNDRIRGGEVWRLFTATAVHDELPALVLNGVAFLAVAPLLELLLGGPRLVFAFVVGGVVATGASYLLFPAATYMGASGAVAAAAGALLALALRRRAVLPDALWRRLLARGAAAIATLFVGALVLPDTDFAALGGGLALGVLAGLAFAPPEDARAALDWARARALRG